MWKPPGEKCGEGRGGSGRVGNPTRPAPQKLSSPSFRGLPSAWLSQGISGPRAVPDLAGCSRILVEFAEGWPAGSLAGLGKSSAAQTPAVREWQARELESESPPGSKSESDPLVSSAWSLCSALRTLAELLFSLKVSWTLPSLDFHPELCWSGFPAHSSLSTLGG